MLLQSYLVKAECLQDALFIVLLCNFVKSENQKLPADLLSFYGKSWNFSSQCFLKSWTDNFKGLNLSLWQSL